MATCLDVAQYILEKLGDVTTIKLQKLVYYCQAWSLVWTEAPLFPDRVEAWANGPVVPRLYEAHKGAFAIGPATRIGDSSKLTETDRTIIDAVLRFYGDKGAQWLVELTHMEEPWVHARSGYSPGARCNVEISQSAMAEYYSGLVK